MEEEVILVVDDTPSNLDILGGLLKDYDVISCVSGEEALEVVKEEKVDLILLDIMMPEMDGFEVCEILKKDTQTKDIPVIFITAKTDEESIEKAYTIGGVDYVTKPFKPTELLVRVKKELNIQKMVRELKFLASTDSMTKLYNRRYFKSVTSHVMEIAKRDKQPLSVVMLDIDKFKNINDTYGHKVGDDVIVFLAEKLFQTYRKSDILCRYGGEEFVVMLPSTKKESAVEVAQHFRKIIKNSVVNSDVDVTFTISLGVADVDLENEQNIENALKRADDALYRAKEGGRDMVCVDGDEL